MKMTYIRINKQWLIAKRVGRFEWREENNVVLSV